jgi:tetratricopeptide (TPR) repeat protein
MPKDRNARLMLAQAALELERYNMAGEHFRLASEMMPENPKAWYGLGRSHEGLARQKETELEKTAPGSPWHHLLLAASLVKQRRFGSAMRHHKEALAVDSGLSGVAACLARLIREKGAGECDSGPVPASTAAATSPEALYWASKSHRRMAGEAYERLTRLPPSPESRMHAAKTLENLSLYPEAVREWREALALTPEDIRIQAGLASALFHARDFAAALPLLEKLMSAGTSPAETHFLYGASLLGLEEPEAAVAHLAEALKSDPQFLPARAALGQAYLRLGKTEQAIPHLEASLATDEDGSRRFQLARAYRLAGRPEDAKRAIADYENFRRRAEEILRMEEGGEQP